jgi:LPS export ABC transporter protein LptC
VSVNLYIIIVIPIVFLLGCGTTANNSDDTIIETVEQPDQMSWDVYITITHSGQIRANIKADYLEQFNDNSSIFLEDNVKMNFYNTEERIISTLFADRAQINEQVNFLQATDNIIVESDSGVTLFTDTLTWDNEKEVIFTDDSVMITTESNDTLYGVGFQSDINMEQWKILKPSGVSGK